MSYSILVTGGAGYLGSILIPDLLQAGHQVTVLDNFMYKQASLHHVCHHPKFQVVKRDIRLESTIAPLLKKAETQQRHRRIQSSIHQNLDCCGSGQI